MHYRTQRFSSGECIRPLSDHELGQLLGFPNTIPRAQLAHLVPPSVMRSLLQAAHGLLHEENFGTEALVPKPIPTFEKDTATTYVPELQRHMTHAWREEVEATFTSVKHDDATVPIHWWNRRISDLFLSMTARCLDVLRAFVLRWAKRKVLQEILHFLQTYTPTVLF